MPRSPAARRVAAVLAVAVTAAPAAAHVSLEPAEGPAGGTLRVAVVVPHGCGAAATTAVRVTLPEALEGARPLPKPGWTLRLTRTPLDPPRPAAHGRVRREAVTAIAWEGGRLESAHADEFVLRLGLPDAPSTVLPLPVLQSCEDGTAVAWDAPPPAAGEGPPARPAPLLRVVDDAEAHRH